ncbi:ThiF family adenylyltransferase [Mesorhizobium sp. M0320]|uniref:ThiF family adenylyltransferase n=1 Tax=Mesorhizobium sp. M0320 TaxID=2956936 RepID=UPI00333848F5
MIWHLGRLLLWIDAAATDQLSRDGDPFEIPASPNGIDWPVIGFSENLEDLSTWAERLDRWGVASLIPLPGMKGGRVVQTFADSRGKDVRVVAWGRWAASPGNTQPAVWIKLDRMPIVLPWSLPRTWRELTGVLATENVDLGKILMSMGQALRRLTQRSEPATLLLGFPAPERVGNPPARMHWLAVESIPVASSSSARNGFRSIERVRQVLDGRVAASTAPIAWVKTANWAPDQIRRRSPGGSGLRDIPVLIIGAGALGGAVAENLVRMGANRLQIMDPERLEIGNLTRHVLGLEAVGRNKATALASGLNSMMIDADIVGHAVKFPPLQDSIADDIRSCRVVIDCTGSDAVLHQMAKFDWASEKIFVSLAVTWAAEGFLAYTASEARFPALDAIQRFSSVTAPRFDELEAPMEGIGCWHPVFPANAEDIRMWASVGTKIVRAALSAPKRNCAFFRRFDDGRIERSNV